MKKRFVSVCAALLIALPLCLPVYAAGEDFSITNYNIIGQTRVSAGSSFEIHLTLSQMEDGANKSEIDTHWNDIRFYIDEAACSFYLTDGNEDAQLPKMRWFENRISGEVTIPLTYDGGTRNTIPIKAKIRSTGQELTFIQDSIKVPVASSATTDDPDPTPDSSDTPYLRLKPRATPSGNAGERVYLSLTVENLGWENAKTVQIMPVFEENSVFTPDGVNMIQDLGDIEYDSSRNVSYSFLISPAAETKVYTLTFAFIYLDPEGNIYGRDTPITDKVYVSVTGGGVVSNLILTDLKFAPEGALIAAALQVRNTGAFAAKNLVFTLTDLSAETLTLTADTNVRKLGDLAGGAAIPVDFMLRPARELTRGSYPLTVKLNYKDADDKAFEETQQIFVPVETNQGGSTVPKIILDSYRCEPVIARAGENFTLNMTYLNTSSTNAVRNIKIFLTVPQGDSDSSNSAAAKGNVFSPVSSSNTFFIDYIAPKATSAKTLQFYTIPDASPRTYTLTANIEYEDETGQKYASEELIGIPVSQMVKIDVSELILPSEAYAGDLITVSTNFYNTGRANVSNLMLNLEGDFQTDNARYYVGNFNTGASDYYEGGVIANEPGSLEGSLLVTYDDPSGEQVAERYPFSLNVLEMEEFIPDDNMPVTPPPSTPWWKKPVLWIGVAAAIILFFLLRKRGPVRKFLRRRKEGAEGSDETV
ncbi:MAG: hypothetical protein LBS10_04500 [Gracilibacteraceae bacterium]|jgi:hypothetical protein|nr:hypothetical protein [Gracilibacteraceae bacterium]